MSNPWDNEVTPMMDNLLHECPKVTEIVLRARDLERRLRYADGLLDQLSPWLNSEGLVCKYLAAAREEDGR